MEEFTITLADIPIMVKPFRSEIQPFFHDYLSNEAPLFAVAPTKEDLEYEEFKFRKRNEIECSSRPFSDRLVELSAILRLIANRLPAYNVILFHGSAVAVEGRAFLFTAASGTGKTTHTRLWLQALPQAHVLNGDKPFLKMDSDGQVLVCGTPWMGKERFGCNEILPLEAICVLERAKENHISPVSQQRACQELLHRVHLPDGIAGVQTVQLLDRICRKVRLFRLGCNMEPEAAKISIQAMMRKEPDEIPASDIV